MKISRNLGIVALVSFINSLSLSVIIPVIYVIGKKYGLNDFAISLLITSFAGSQFLANPIIGRLSDYFGRKPLLTISLFGTAVSNLMVFFAPNAAFLFIARIFDGITGGNNSVAQAIISDITEPQERNKAYGIYGAAFGVGFIVGPIISILLQNISISAPFLGSAISALIGSAVSAFVLTETNIKKETHTLNLLNFGFIQNLKAITFPVIGPIYLINLLSGLMFGLIQFGIQPFIINILKLNSNYIGYVLFMFGIVAVIVQAIFSAKIAKRFGYFNTILFGIVGSSILLILTALSSNFSFFIIIFTLFAVFNSIYKPVLISLLTLKTRKEDQGIALGIGDSYNSLAFAIGPVIAGLVVGFGYELPFLAGAIIGLVTILVIYIKRDSLRSNVVVGVDF